ncbi:hypothetical protein GEV33_007033 [Tenebrio molitor]|uniref:Myb-like domain-containing protein n=1 Tax=Tenebrio molitor TaxID=7067 RepID=A0A8J6HK23_TENMO|nr:hypothetical protein GEV33_007033 [Tenebrio molitor]
MSFSESHRAELVPPSPTNRLPTNSRDPYNCDGGFTSASQSRIQQNLKTSNSTVDTEEKAQLSPELGQKENEKPNLTVTHEIPHEDDEIGETLKIPPEGKVDDVDRIEENINDGKSEGGCDPTSAPDKVEKQTSSGTTKDTSENVNNTTLNDKPVMPVRRKFIKPAVSLNAITRKAKEPEETKPVAVNGQKQQKNNKIIILDEVITYQNQHVTVPNHSLVEQKKGEVTPEPSNNLLKPPEIVVERDTRRLVSHSPQLLTPEIEYPIPPPSPNKVNRSRIKAVPRFGQRNTSFSASESEDESRRNHRHRNDSVCSSASGLQDTNSIPECPSPQKPKEFNSVIQRKCRRTEQSRKLAEARRDFYLKFGNKKPDRQKLTMIDLIFYNPVTNPMSHDNKSKRKNSEVENEEQIEEDKVEEIVDDPGVEAEATKSGSDEENEIPAPQIKIGPQGELVVDEQSLVIENKAVKKNREELEKSKVVNGDFDTGYGVYKRAKRSKDWSKHETLKFYKALNTIGTDFTLMCELFPRRSRRELKMKFKKEERVNKALVDKAIMQPCGFDFNDFKHEVDMEEKELEELEKQKERERQLKKEAKKRKASLSSNKSDTPEKVPKVEEKPKEEKKKKRALDIMNVLEDDSDADESEMESVEDDETQDTLLQTIQKPTRSGRVPKLLDRYRAPEPETKTMKAKPGSLIVVAGTGANGQPVYRVCMVTGEDSRQQIGQDMTSLEKALECKENSYIKSLFTLSATRTQVPENNQTIPAEENNITIPADEEINNHTDYALNNHN